MNQKRGVSQLFKTRALSAVLLAILGFQVFLLVVPANATTQSGSWRSVGPTSIASCGYGGASQICAGVVTSIAPDSAHPGTIYLGGEGGVWKTTNGGSNWIPLSDGLPSLGSLSVEVDNNGVVFASSDVGVLKSSDAGSSWTQLGASTLTGGVMSKIAISPNDPNLILASVYYSPGGSVPSGVYQSRDSGSTWTRTITGSSYDVEVDPVQTQQGQSTVYAVVNQAVVKSNDSGTTWTTLSSFPSQAPNVITISPSSHLTLFVATNSGGPGQLIKSTDGGTSWITETAPPGSCANMGTIILAPVVAVDPTNPNTVYFGGNDLCRTTDGGATWTDIGGYSGYMHPDQHAIGFSPGSHSTVYAGNDGGIWYSTAGDTCAPSACWTNLSAGLGNTLFRTLATHPTDPNMFLGGTQDNGTPERKNNSSTWSFLFGGDGGWTSFDSSSPSTLYVTYQWPSTPLRSDNGGTTLHSVGSGINTNDRATTFYPVAMDPSTPSTLYLGTYRVYKTTNKGDNWFLPSPGLTLSTGTIVKLAVSKSPNQYLYAGTDDGRVFASTDGGSNFVESDAGLPAGGYTERIAIDPTNPQRVLVAFAVFNGAMYIQQLFLSTNAGSTWNNISPSFTQLVTSAVLDSTGDIFVGTAVGSGNGGVFVSSNSGGTWTSLGIGLPKVAVNDMAFAADGSLTVATYGRGVWSLNADFTISENPVSLIFPIGSKLQTNLMVSSVGVFSGTVNLVETPSSGGLSCWFTTQTNTASVTVPAGGQASQVLTCTSFTPDTYTVTITGTSGSINHSVSLSVTIQGFSITGPGSVSFPSGSSSSASVTLTSLFGFTGTVYLSAVSPSAVTVSCPSSVSLTSGSTVTTSCSVSSSTSGQYSMSIVGTYFCSSNCFYDSDSYSTGVTVNVGDFSISVNPTTATISRGSSTTSTITLTSLYSFSGSVTLSVTSLTPTKPHMPTVSITPGTVSLTSNGSGTSTLNFQTTSTTSKATYIVTVTAQSGSITHTTTFMVTVN